MQEQTKLISTAITALFVFGVSAGTVQAAETEKCFGVAKAGQNACNSNVNRHSCAGHSKIDKDPADFINVPKGSCLKLGGKLEATEHKSDQVR